MGQTLTVTMTPGARPEIRNFATDRSITGMAIERFPDAESAMRATKPANVLARRLFELGAVHSVAVYSNTVTVEADAHAWPRLEPKVMHALEYLFHYYGDDAGWSVEALKPYGIERTPSPVQ
jgi:hypothetical protein